LFAAGYGVFHKKFILEEKMKKSGIIAGFMLAAVLLLAGCENPVGDGKSQQYKTVTIENAGDLQKALQDKDTGKLIIKTTLNTNVEAVVTVPKMIEIPAGVTVELNSLTTNADVSLIPSAEAETAKKTAAPETGDKNTLPVGEVVDTAAGGAQLNANITAAEALAVNYADTGSVGVFKIKNKLVVSKNTTFEIQENTNLVFASAVTKENTVVNGAIKAVEAGSIYKESSSESESASDTIFSGEGTVKTSSTAEEQQAKVVTITIIKVQPSTPSIPSSPSSPSTPATPAPTYTISGALSHTTETIGGRTFSFSDFGSVNISLKAFGETTYTTTDYSSDSKIVNNIIAAGEYVGTVNISGSAYTISGVPAGTYRLTAEDPTGLYDFVDNEVEVVDGNVTRDIELKVFPGLKLTVRMPKTFISYYSEYGGKFTLPVRSGKSIDKTTTQENMTINLDVDWGDGTASKLTTAPDGNEDPDYTHSYADALGDSDEKEFVVRVTGTCISEFVKGGGGTDVGKFAMGHDPDRSGAPGGKYAGWTYGMWHYGNMDKMIKAAGNITALTGDLTDTRYTYLFLKCRELKDISGLVFTETNPGDLFLSRAFEQCTALTAIPAGLLPHATSVGLGFLSEAFKGSGLAAIPDGFLPSYTTVGNSFLKGAFGGVNAGDSTDIREIPVGFIPASLTEVGNYFLANTFYGCKELTTIPAGFASPIKKIGSYFLDSTFGGCDKLTSIPPNFLPQSPSTIADHFLASTFTMSGITSIPVDLIPEGYKSITTTGTHFLFQSFTNNQNINTVDLSFLQNINVSNSSFLNKFVSGCANLTEAYIPYISFNGNTSPFSNAFQNPGSPINLYISGGGTSNVLLVNNSAGLIDAKVTAIYLDNATLVAAYQGSSNWSAISDSKFQARP
jgi:hypothetical protein